MIVSIQPQGAAPGRESYHRPSYCAVTTDPSCPTYPVQQDYHPDLPACYQECPVTAADYANMYANSGATSENYLPTAAPPSSTPDNYYESAICRVKQEYSNSSYCEESPPPVYYHHLEKTAAAEYYSPHIANGNQYSGTNRDGYYGDEYAAAYYGGVGESPYHPYPLVHGSEVHCYDDSMIESRMARGRCYGETVPLSPNGQKFSNLYSQSALNSAGPGGRIMEGSLLCAVCGDNAACQHYGVRTCEGCKGFFKRTVQKKAKYVCLAEKKCPVDKRRRNRCQFCRFQKCLAVGMVKEVVRSDSLKGRRGRLPTKSKNPNQAHTTPLVPLIHMLVRGHMDGPTDQPQLSFINDFSEDEKNIKYLLDILSITSKFVHGWLGKVSAFSEINKEDKEQLARGSCLDYFLLKLAFRLKAMEETIVLPDGATYFRSQCTGLIGQLLLAVADFSLILERADIDVQSFACLLTLSILADRGVKEPAKVISAESKVTDTLRDHCTYHTEAQKKPRLYPRVLSLMGELRTLSQQIQSKINLVISELNISTSHEVACILRGKRKEHLLKQP